METAKVGHFSPCHSVRRMSLAHYSSTDVFWVKLTPAPGYTCFWWKTCDTDLLNTNMNNKDSCSNPLRFQRTDTMKTWTDVVEHMSAMCFCQCPQNTPTHKPVIVQDQYLSLLTVQLRLASLHTGQAMSRNVDALKKHHLPFVWPKKQLNMCHTSLTRLGLKIGTNACTLG